MIPKIVIFSKNRACQLELLLRSLHYPATILYLHSPEYKNSYDIVTSMYDQEFVYQDEFKDQLIDIIRGNEYVLFLTDDDVMVGDIDEFNGFDNDTVSLSIALKPKYGNKWEWKKYRSSRGYVSRLYGYPMSVDSCIFKVGDILPIIEDNTIKTPNYLEMFLNSNIPDKPYMMCLDSTRVLNNALNQVQSDFPYFTSGSRAKVPIEELDERFLRGDRLSLSYMIDLSESALCYRVEESPVYENK
jgi:hypothetical protein